MKKPFLILIALMLALCAFPTLADDGRVAMQIISCPEQGFSTLCLPEYCYDYTPDGGLTIYVGEPDRQPYITVFKTDAPGRDFDAKTYFSNAYLSMIRASYGSDLLNEGEYGTFSIGGRDLPGRMVLYRRNGERRMRFCVFDLQDTYFVRYEAFYAQNDEEIRATLTALSVAAGNFRPDPGFYSSSSRPQMQETAPDLQTIRCPEQDFSIPADPSYAWKLSDGGVTVYTGPEGSIPYIIVVRSGDLIGEPFEYIREQLTPHVRKQYGADLIGVTEYESYPVAGKELPAALYTYRLKGYVIEMLRILDSTGESTVSYTAKYVQGRGDATLEALDLAVSGFMPSADGYPEG